jgi:long-chain acyl-CoA synthetase
MNVLAELISRAGYQFAPREALSGDRSTMTFAEVEADSNRLASALARELGVTRGERVAILLANCPEFVVADFALMKAGLIRVPINPRYTAGEITFILKHSAATVLITGPGFEAVVPEIRRATSSLRHVVVTEPVPALPDVGEWRVLLDTGSPDAFAVDTTDTDGYMLAYTSGTTGRPKGAFTTVRARLANVFNVYANEMFVTPSDVMLHVASLAHGSGTKVLPIFAKGAKNVLLPKFSVAAFFRAVERHKVTISWMVPTMMAMLADAAERTEADCSSLTTIIYGGAPMPAPVVERALAAFGPIFVQMYGLTEAPHPDLVLGKHEHVADPVTGHRPGVGATGRAAIGVNLRLVDDAGDDVPPGSVGEIIIAGEHVMAHYWNDPEATAATLRDGWCYTGDMARMDAGGFYYIVDRKKEMIISGGYNVYPREVEDVLYRHPAIAECAVIGSPDELWGETVHAIIVAKAEGHVATEDVLAHCARELAGYKKPRRISVVADLPKTANGKIDKKALRIRFSVPAAAAAGANRERIE